MRHPLGDRLFHTPNTRVPLVARTFHKSKILPLLAPLCRAPEEQEGARSSICVTYGVPTHLTHLWREGVKGKTCSNRCE